jgi:hypothetical protein
MTGEPDNSEREIANGAPRRTLIAAVLLGGSWLGSYLAYRSLALRGWPATDRLPVELRTDAVQYFLPLGPVRTAWMAFLAPAGLVLLWSLLESVLRLDPTDVSWRSLRWTARVLTHRPGIEAVAWYLLIGILGLWLAPFVFGYLSLAVAMVVPFAILKTGVATSDSGGRWWRPRWPGLFPAVSALLLLPTALLVLALAGLSIYRLGAPGRYLGDVLGLLVTALLLPAAAAIVLFRLGPRDIWKRWPVAFGWSRIGPCIAFQARAAYAYLLIVAPLALGFLLIWKNVPLADQWLAGQGQSAPWTARTIIGGVNLLGRLGFPLVALPIAVLYLLPLARMLWLLRSEAPDD